MLKIVKTKLNNSDCYHNYNNPSYETYDSFYIESGAEVCKNIDTKSRLASTTDYGIAMGALVSPSKEDRTLNQKYATSYYLRSADISYRNSVESVSFHGLVSNTKNDLNYIGIRPCFNVTIESFSEDIKNKSIVIDNDKYSQHTFIIKDYLYPTDKVDDELSKDLDLLYSVNQLKKTGKQYKGFVDLENNIDTYNEEFKYNNNYYVRTKCNRIISAEYYYNADKTFDGSTVWMKVEPIVWQVANWEDMPKSINPKGNGTAETVKIRSEEIINCVPFNRNKSLDSNFVLWQNSEIRAYLNGYNLVKEIMLHGNGNKNFAIRQNDINFVNRGFLQEIDHSNPFLMKKFLASDKTKKVENVYKFDLKKLNNDEILKNCIMSNTSVFLHGPSGVGKSARVKALDPSAVFISLRPQMNPEEVDGTLDRETGKYIPPLWYTKLCENCRREPKRKHILFIDELTNVKPTVQSLVYSIVLDRAGKDGLWKLPDNAVVVAAGNETKDNLAAFPLTNALFRRFCHIYYDVDKNDWFVWATGINHVETLPHTDNLLENKGVHPLIVGYVLSKAEKVLYQDLDEENPWIVVDPRKWETASNILYTSNNPYALEPAIGKELTNELLYFIKKTAVTLDDVVKGNYDKNSFNDIEYEKKYYTMYNLLTAKPTQLPEVRTFIKKYLDLDLLNKFDELWANNNPKKIKYIKDIKKNEKVKENENGKNEHSRLREI